MTDMSADNIQFRMGRTEGRMDGLEQRVDKVETSFASIDTKLDVVIQQMDEARGGAKLRNWMLGILMSAAGVSATLWAASHHVAGIAP